jgi:hypothetical protein
MSNRSDSNRNSRIVTRNRPGSVYARYTRTAGRDPGTLQAAVVTESNGSTAVEIERAGASLLLNGHEARTLFNVLAKHYWG